MISQFFCAPLKSANFFSNRSIYPFISSIIVMQDAHYVNIGYQEYSSMDSHLMKMIWAVIRPERVDVVVGALKTEGFSAMTRFDVYGRGKQKGIVVAGESYDMPKTVLMLVLEAGRISEAVKIIERFGQNRGP